MNRDAAELLVSTLNAVFPPALPDIGFAVYVRVLERLEDEETAAAAVETLIGTAHFMPKPVEITDTYRSLRRQRDEQCPRCGVQLRGGVELADHLANVHGTGEGFKPSEVLAVLPVALRDMPAEPQDPPPWQAAVLPLEPGEDGDCDDRCGETGQRYRYGRVQVCERCARSRLRAAGKAA